MKENIEEDIKILENMNDGYTFKDCDICNNYNEKTKQCDKHKCMELQAIEHILSDYKRVLKENEELKNEIMEKELEIVGKEEYTKASMGEIIEQYYTANEDCITKQKIEKLIEELKQDDINMTRKYKEKNNITGELLGIDKVRVRAYREKTREINEKLHKLLIETKGK